MIERKLQEGITLGEYRALVGLLEHLRLVSRREADTANALYIPDRKGGDEGRSVIVNVTNLMHQLLERWLTIVLESAGAAVTIALEDNAEERLKKNRRARS